MADSRARKMLKTQPNQPCETAARQNPDAAAQ